MFFTSFCLNAIQCNECNAMQCNAVRPTLVSLGEKQGRLDDGRQGRDDLILTVTKTDHTD